MATKQTPARPWFRLGSIPRQPAPKVPAAEPAPPQPRPPVARPTFWPPQPTRTEPTSPPPAAAPQPPAPRAPASAAVPTAPTPTVPRSPAPRALAPSSSLPASPAPAISTVVLPVTTTYLVPSSPKPRVSAPSSSVPSKPATTTSSVPPPAPLTLPPSQIKHNAQPDSKSPPEVVQKDVLMQKTIEKANGNNHKPSIDHTAKEVDTKGKAHRKKLSSSDTEEGGTRIITIAGENKGAIMEVIKSPKKNGFEDTSSLYKKGNPGGTSSDSGSEFQSYSSSSSSEKEGSRNMKDKKNRGMSMNSTPMSAFMNSNVQGVNNSIVFKSSSTQNDPGVHLALSGKPSNGGFHVEGRSNGYDS